MQSAIGYTNRRIFFALRKHPRSTTSPVKMAKSPANTPAATTTPPLSDAAAEELVRDNIHWMLALAERILRDRDAAEDVVQEAFIAAFRSFGDFRGDAELATWLHRITVNTALSRLRKQRRLAEQSIDEYLPEFDRYDCRIEPPWRYLLPLQTVQEDEDLQAFVSKTIAELPDSYRVVLQLRDIEGYDTAEVAAALGISAANVKVRLHRARAALKKRLEPLLRGEGDR